MQPQSAIYAHLSPTPPLSKLFLTFFKILSFFVLTTPKNYVILPLTKTNYYKKSPACRLGYYV